MDGTTGNKAAALAEALSPQRDAVNAYVAELNFDGQVGGSVGRVESEVVYALLLWIYRATNR